MLLNWWLTIDAQDSSSTAKMPAISNAVIAREAISHIAKRSTWASRQAGVIVVFAIVFIVLVGVIGLFISRRCASARARRAQLLA